MNKSARRIAARIVASLVVSSFFLFPVAAISSAQEVVLGESTNFTASQQVLLVAKPSVTQITNIITGEVVIQAVLAAELGTPQLSGMTYPFEIGMSGSGFFVTPDGYLVTNGHVANPDNDLIAYYALGYTAEQIFKDAVAALAETYYGYTLTESELQLAYDEELQYSYGGNFWTLVDDFFYSYEAGELEVDDVTLNNYIQTGTASGTETIVQDLGKAATLIDSPYEGASDSSDLALLKVSGSNYPSIGLGSFQDVQVGAEVYAVGYPAIVEEYTGVFTDVESGIEPSITQGIISAKKTLVDGSEAFQTDAGITHGNSGGPVLNSNGEVIGVATWGLGDSPGGESFNFLISVEEVDKLLLQNNVTPSTSITTQKWEEALDLYSQKCYTDALELFEESQNLYPDNVDLNDFIARCQTAIENGEDECLSLLDNTLVLVIGGVLVCGGGLVVLIIIVIAVTRKKKSTTEAAKPSVPPAETPAMPAGTSAPAAE